MTHVILIHGQGRTPLSMSLLGCRLKRQGYPVHYFGYIVTFQRFERITQRFVRTVQEKIKGQPYIIVGHSLGAIITRAALPHLADHPPRHLVMLAPPNQCSWIAQKMRSNPIYRFLTWDCGRKLASQSFYEDLPQPTVPTTMIAGTRGWPSAISPFGGEANDGVLAVSETRLAGAAEPVRIPATHPFIMNSKQVAKIVIEILQREIRRS